MAKKALIAAAVLVVILVIGLKFVGSNLDSIVQRAIETTGSEVTGVRVNVDKVALTLKEGRGEIRGLVVDNPKGYKERHAFSLGSIALDIDPKTITQDVVVIQELTIDAPDMVYEDASGTSNVEAIAKNADDYARAHPSGEDTAKKDEPAAATRFIVESLQIRNGKVRLPDAERGDGVIDLPAIRMRDVGKSRGGMTGPQIAQAVIGEMTDAVKTAARQALAERGKERAKDAVKDRLPSRR